MARAHLTQHYEQLLGLEPPWRIQEVDLDHDATEVRIRIALTTRGRLRCPVCQALCGRHDHRTRRWRHLDTMQYTTILEAEVPRVRCQEHGVHQIEVSWAEENSRYTALFEALVIGWLHETSTLAVARQLRLSWDQVAGIQARAVRRGLARRVRRSPTAIGVDETSFQKRHEYVTVVNDLDEGVVLHVADNRRQEVLESYFEDLGPKGCAALENIAMDKVYRLLGRPIAMGYQGCNFTYGDTKTPVPIHTYASLAKQVVDRWYKSPGHKKNLLNPKFRRLGSGVGIDPNGPACGDFYLTQNFAD